MLRGHFDEEIFPGGILYLYRDHFGITSTINGELHFMSIQSEILTLGDFRNAAADPAQIYSAEFRIGSQRTDCLR